MTSGDSEHGGSAAAVPAAFPPPGTALPEPAATDGPPAVPDEPVGVAPARGSRLRRRLAVAASVLWSLGLLGAGVALGYRLRDPDPVPPAEVVISVDPASLDALQPGGEIVAVMPAVLGLSEADARAVLADGGFASDDITVVEVPRAGQAGRVASQEPAAGTESPGAITLSLSSPAEMPTLLGLTRAEAEEAIRELGARPAFARAYEPGAAPDTVLATSPEPGEPVPDLVTITLASRPASLFLSEVQSVESDCGRGADKANGVESENAISCSLPSVDGTRVISWDLSRRADRFTAEVGLSDDSALDGVGRVTVLVDGVVVGEFDARFGALTTIDVEVRNGLRLELRVTTIAEPADGSARVVLLDPALLGAEDSINELAGQT